MDAPKIVRDGIDLRGHGPRLADTGVRLGAFILDGLLIAGWAVAVAATCSSAIVASGPPADLPITFGFIAVAVAGVSLYFVLMECSPLQGTLGKYLLGMKVTDMAGRRITLHRAVGRTAGKVGFAVGFWPTCIVSLYLIFLTKNRQAIHDMLAGTLVAWPDGVPPAEPPPSQAGAAPPPPAHPDGITPARDGVRG